MRSGLTTVALTALLATSVAACSSGDGVGAAGQGGRLSVVASTNVWGDVVAEVGGDLVTVTSVISDPAADPHSYEANARTQLALSKASLVVANGGGYDDIVDTMVNALDSPPPVLHAVDIAATGEDNEHVWYSLAALRAVADEVATRLGELDPAHAADFSANADAFDQRIGDVEAQVAALRERVAGARVAITEPVPLYLLQDAGLVDVTPPAFSAAIEEETDVPPAVLSQTLGLFAGGGVDVLVYNSQTTGPQTEQVLAAARAAGVPVVAVTETLPAGQDVPGWMAANVAALQEALAR